MVLLKSWKGSLKRRQTGSDKYVHKIYPWMISLNRETSDAFKIKSPNKKLLYMEYFYMSHLFTTSHPISNLCYHTCHDPREKSTNITLLEPHPQGALSMSKGITAWMMHSEEERKISSELLWSFFYMVSYVFLLGQWLLSDTNNLHFRQTSKYSSALNSNYCPGDGIKPLKETLS